MVRIKYSLVTHLAQNVLYPSKIISNLVVLGLGLDFIFLDWLTTHTTS